MLKFLKPLNFLARVYIIRTWKSGVKVITVGGHQSADWDESIKPYISYIIIMIVTSCKRIEGPIPILITATNINKIQSYTHLFSGQKERQKQCSCGTRDLLEPWVHS